jgi:3-methyladenine DNA glycosylase AlkD
MYDSYIKPLQELLIEKADPKVKYWWEGYVKQSAPFLGIKMPTIRTTLHQWHRELIDGNLEDTRQVDLALALFAEKHTEEKLAGTLYLQEILLPIGAIKCERDAERFADLFVDGYIYDWNICDWFCVKVLGPLIHKDGVQCAGKISAWHRAENLWQARASLVAFVKVADNRTYYPMIERSCHTVIRREERFAKTSVGWILRDISKHDRPFVKRVIEDNLAYFSTESLNNATKYFTKDEQNEYRQMFKDVFN